MDGEVKEIRVMTDVRDLASVRAFYTGLLGFAERRHENIPDWIAMFELGPGRVIEFFQEEQPKRPPVEISLEVADVRRLWERIREQAPIAFPLRHNDWGDTSFGLTDPVGGILVFFTPD